MEIDQLDKQIINLLLQEARTPYATLAKKAGVSTATIHVRLEKLRRQGIVRGTRLRVDRIGLGFDVLAFIGIILKNAGDYQIVREKLERLPQVLEAYYTTGTFNLFTKVMLTSISDLQRFLFEKIQSIEAVQSTETIIALETCFHRDIQL